MDNIQVSFKEEVNIPEKVTFGLDPYKSDNPEIKAVFNDDLAKIIWIAIRRNHIIDQYFNTNCLKLAKMLRMKKYNNIDGKILNNILRSFSMIGSMEEGVGDKILPFIKGKKTFEIKYKLDE